MNNEKNINSLLLEDHIKHLWNYVKIEYQEEVHIEDENFNFEGSTNVKVYIYEIQTERIERRNDFLNLPIINNEYTHEIKNKHDNGYDYTQCFIDNISQLKLSEKFKYQTICIGYVLKDTESKEVRLIHNNIILLSDYILILDLFNNRNL